MYVGTGSSLGNQDGPSVTHSDLVLDLSIVKTFCPRAQGLAAECLTYEQVDTVGNFQLESSLQDHPM